MSLNILVTDPNTGFAMMLQQTLEATGRFKVVIAQSGAQALGAAKDAAFDLAIVESELEDFSLGDLVVGLRSRLPDLAIMVIPPFGAKELGDTTILDLQGALPKPFYLPQLESMVDEALAKPVHGKMRTDSPQKAVEPQPVAAAPAVAATPPPPPPRAPTASPSPVSAIAPKAAPKPVIAPVRSDSKSIDVDRAAQYLTTLTLESAANAAMLIDKNHQTLIASAGHLDQSEVAVLLRSVSAHWAKTASGAQVQIVGEQLLYSTLVTSDVIMAMVFQAQTPLSMIRKQAKHAAGILKSSSKEEARTIPQTVEREAPRLKTPPAHDAPSTSASLDPFPLFPKVPLPPSIESPDSLPSFPEVPLPPSPESLPNLKRTAHGLYAMAYTFLIVPRLAFNELKGDLRDHLHAALRQIASSYDWQVTALDVQPHYVEISLSCPPTDAPDYVIRSLMRDSSERVLNDFPRIARDHGRHPGIFWSHNYWATSAQKFSRGDIEKLLEYQRKEHG
jgi:REP element-mobilizing transposase RayT/DNA-binding NarL/FixJ family response regulator